ncbi:MAG TPA: LCP family protein, partial [Acidimicrobiales bacterium]
APDEPNGRGPGTERAPRRKRSRRRLLPRRPRLRRVLMLLPLLLPLLLLLVALGGWLYARSVYNKIERVPVSDVLSTGGNGTNYLLVGSDSRDVQDLIDAGLNPEAFEDGGGQRSDTMLLLHFGDDGAKMMSIPRDLYVPIAGTGSSSKINAAYNGGPTRLIQTIQQSLGVPVHHYLEVDFVSFASLVDSLGGITIEFPNPAYDRNSGLDVQQAGPVTLDGPQALAYVRSRHLVEVIDGQDRPDATADLGRVQRQQQFLSAVFGKLGDSRNPITLARAASSASGGLRIDDSMTLVDTMRLAWRLRSLDAESLVLPTQIGSNSSGSVLFLVEPDAEAVLAQLR